MPVMDEFKEERETIKNAPFSKKLEYFKDYYLMKTIIAVVTAAILGGFLFSYFSKKQIALYVTLVNFSEMQEPESLIAPFAQEEINSGKEEIFIDSSSYISSDMNEVNFIKYGYEDEQRLFSMVMTGEMDLFISGGDVLERYAAQQWFEDLSTVIPEADLNRMGEDSILVFNGVPVGIRIRESSALFKYYYYNGKQGEAVYAGFPAGSVHKDLAVKFVQYLMR
jgi:ABC-type glycerol-3-phosphate transport system substrate-binding protein